ncbi:MAG: bifunctional folylpolyglutamate synthase/dihydrofolate synthase [Acidobacteria bacterium]|nr:bifunctional folylpolyglutamate synthase/dihydrofolate synthase [Acidobacteriota bacterium]
MPEDVPVGGSVDALLAHRLEQRILPGLDRMRRALDVLGHPERRVPAVLIVGTNGKGSTAALLDAVVRAHGLRVGLYTSPHLVRVEERIRIAGEPIAAARLRELVATLERFPALSYFETLTVAAFLCFAEAAVDLAILEAGLGGRWDATNATTPLVALLTNVGTDHQAWLGPTRGHIAAEKAVALRGKEAIVGRWDDEVEAVIRREADPSTPLSLASDWATVKEGERGEGRGKSTNPATLASALPSPLTPLPRFTSVAFSVAGTTGDAMLPLYGRHQLDNLVLALAGAAALARHGAIPGLRADAITAGIEGTTWPGRLQWVEWRGHRLLLDGAHNREATAALAASILGMGLSGRLHLLFSCLDDKPAEAMADLLRPHVRDVLLAPIDSPRAVPVDRLAAAFPEGRPFPSVAAALAALPPDLPTLVTGSLRLVGEVMAHTER